MRKLTALVIASLFIVQMQAQEGKKIVGYSPVKAVFIDGNHEVDNDPPVIKLENFSSSRRYKSPYTLKGYVTDASPLSYLTIDGFNTEVDKNGKFSIKIDLQHEINSVIIKAKDINANESKLDIQIKRDETPDLVKETKDYLLVFAVSEYKSQSWSDFGDGMFTNAEKLASVLKNKYGFETEIVRDPSYDQIKTTIDRYKNDFLTNKKDSLGQLLVFFTGHGEMYLEKTAYFIPNDAKIDDLPRTAISYDILAPWVNLLHVKHTMIYVDACYSAFIDEDFQRNKAGAVTRPWRNPKLTPDQHRLKQHLKYRTRLFLTSDAKAGYAPNPSRLLKVFTDALENNEDNIMDTSEIWKLHILDQITPDPHYHYFKDGNKNGTFIFVKKR